MQHSPVINRDFFRLLAVLALLLASAFVAIVQPLAILTMVALLSTAAALLFLYRPNFVLYAMLFLAPFHFWVTEVLIDTPTITQDLSLGGLYQDIWPIALVGIWLIYAITSRKVTITSPPAFLPLLLFVTWALLHIVSTAPLTATLFGLRNLLRFAVLPLIIPIFVTSRSQIRHLFLAAFLGTALASVVSLTEVPQFIGTLLSTRNLNLATVPAHLRFVGIYGSVRQLNTVVSNTLGIALALMATYGIGRMITAKTLKKKGFFLLCCAALIIFILLTFSRRGYFTLLIGPFLLLWLWQRSLTTRMRMVAFLVILFAIGLIVLEISPVGDYIVGRFTNRVIDNPSFAGRQQDWRIIWDNVTESPLRFLWGYGMASTGPAGVRFGVPNAVHAHNYYLLLWHELGLIGVILFLAVLWELVNHGFKVAKRLVSKELELEAWFAVVVIIALSLNGLLGTTFEAYPNDLFFWTATTLLAAIAKVSQNKMTEASRTHPAHYANKAHHKLHQIPKS